MQYPYIAIPNHYYNELNEYRHDLGYRLFEKYGWVVGERDCSGILPLDQWAPEDRDSSSTFTNGRTPNARPRFRLVGSRNTRSGRVF